MSNHAMAYRPCATPRPGGVGTGFVLLSGLRFQALQDAGGGRGASRSGAWFSPRSAPGRRMMALEASAPLCHVRGLPLGSRNKSLGVTVAPSRPGTSALAAELQSQPHARASFVQRNGASSFHMRRRTIASLRASATVAFFVPIRLASRTPQAFRLDHLVTRFSSMPAASNR